MQTILSGGAAIASSDPAVALRAAPAAAASAFQGYQIIRRNGAVVAFEPNKIAVALMKAFLAVHGTQGAASASVRETVDGLTELVVRALLRSRPGGGTFHIEMHKLPANGSCPTCGKKLVQRRDDEREAVARRIDVFMNQTKPVLEHYEALRLVHLVHADQSVEQIKDEVLSVLQEMQPTLCAS